MSSSEKTTEYEKGEKRGAEDAELDKVKSANNWEGANLGDDDRRSKFLRLMGANKKEHHGRFVIGDSSSKHGRSDDETSRLNRQLEHQYRSGLDLKLSGAARHHTGLGFKQDEEKTDAKSSSSSLPQSTNTAEQGTTSRETCSGEKHSLSTEKDSISKPKVIENANKTDNINSCNTEKQVSKSDETNGKEKISSPSGESYKMTFVKSSD